MSAQMVVIPLTSNMPEGESQQPQKNDNTGSSAAGGSAGSTGSAGASGGRVPKYPFPFPLPIGTYVVFGQDKNHLGEFDSIPSLFRSMHAAGMSTNLPGGSNTVFATVKDLSELKKASFHHDLARLPSGLTIIVGSKSSGLKSSGPKRSSSKRSSSKSLGHKSLGLERSSPKSPKK